MKKALYTLFVFAFSAYYWMVTFLWMAVLFFTTLLLLPLFPYRKTHSWIAAPGFKLCILLGFNKINITYDPLFDSQRKSVFCQNHINFLDAHVAAASIPHTFCGLMHAWQFNIPFYGWMMSLSKGIKVFPEKKVNLILMTSQAKLRHAMGFSILTFPEGGRTRNGMVQRFRKGVFRMARDAGYPVVPIAVKGSYAINRKGTLLFKPFHTIDVRVGPQFETQGVQDSELEQLADQVYHYVKKFAEAA